ncbi:MAG: transporter-related protein [Candidatus Saccharibacteria bacterium]|nr:transporter-related protein [Candidatus Saccharibacteria bacterium]
MSKAQTESIDKLTIKHFWSVMWRFRSEALLSFFIPIQAIFITTLIPFFIGKILGTLGTHIDRAEHYIPDLVICAIIGVTLNWIGFRSLFSLQVKAAVALEKEALETMLNRSVGFHNNRVAGKLVTDATLYPQAFLQLSNNLFINVAPFLVSIVVGTAIVVVHSILLGLLVGGMTISVLVVALWQTIHNSDFREERHQARKKMVAHMADTITNSQTVKTFAREQMELHQGQKLSDALAVFRRRDWTRVAEQGSRRISVLLAFEIAMIALIIHLVKRDPGLLAIGIFTFSYAINLANRLFDIGTIFRTVEDALLDASDMTRYYHEAPEVVDVPGAPQLTVTAGEIVLDNIRFHYQDAAQHDTVFDGLSLTIASGQKVGLVGPSGGGKSTLSRLLLRFEDIQAGTISIDGQSIAEVTQQSLRQAIAYVPQEPLLFHRTIAENIAYGAPKASHEKVVRAAQQAYALEFIEALPKGFDTVVGERGVKLSGGQRQRIAIARAILKDAPLLILDEATSALDSESEAAIQKALAELMKGRTTIVIAHRLSTIQSLDRIIVLDNGRIVEDGSHLELLATNKLYSRLWKRQSGGFIED